MGQSSSAGGGAGLTTAALQGTLPAFANSSLWSTGPGLYPYLTHFFPNGVQAVSGVAYSDAGVTPAASGASGAVPVSLVVGGVAQGAATTGANGYYYFALPAGTIDSGAGSSVLAYTTGAGSAADAVTLRSRATGGLTGFDLDRGWLVETADAGLGSLSALNAAYGAAANGTPAASFAPTSQQVTVAATGFVLDAATTRSGALALLSGGAVTQSAGLEVGSLLLAGPGAYVLTSGDNKIGTLAANAGAVSVADAGSLTVGLVGDSAGAASAGVVSTGAVRVSAAGGVTLASGAAVTAGPGSDVVISATGAFTNDAGATAVTVSGGGRWLIYSADPAGDTFGALDSGNTAVWNTPALASVSASGDRYVFGYQPKLTFTTQNASKTYGTDDSAALASDFTVGGLQPGVIGAYLADTAAAVYSGAPTISSTGSTANASVQGGDYTISASVGSVTVGDGYALSIVSSGKLTVNPLPVMLTGSQVYDGAAIAQGSNLQVANLVRGETAALSGTATMAGKDVVAGGEALTSLAGLNLSNPNYTVSGGSGTVDVTPAALTITAVDQSATYGTVHALSGATATGLQGTDAISGVTETFNPGSGPITATTVHTPAASYAITPSAAQGLDLADYDITYASGGRLTVNPLPVMLTGSQVYDGAVIAEGSNLQVANLVQGDTAALGGTATMAGKDVVAGGEALTSLTGLTLSNPNYTLSGGSGTVDVTPAALTVSANSATKPVSAPDPIFTYAITQGSLLSGDVLSGSLTRQPGTLPGRYPILEGTLNNPDYAITFRGAVLTILPSDVAFQPPPTVFQQGPSARAPTFTQTAEPAGVQSFTGSGRSPHDCVADDSDRFCNAPSPANWNVSPQIHFVPGA
jgi:hypothetical protein